MAPEQFSGKPYDQRADQWQLGCMIFELIIMKHVTEFTPKHLGKMGAKSQEIIDKLKAEIIKGGYPPDHILTNLFEHTLVEDPEQRISAVEVTQKIEEYLAKQEQGKIISEDDLVPAPLPPSDDDYLIIVNNDAQLPPIVLSEEKPPLPPSRPGSIIPIEEKRKSKEIEEKRKSKEDEKNKIKIYR